MSDSSLSIVEMSQEASVLNGTAPSGWAQVFQITIEILNAPIELPYANVPNGGPPCPLFDISSEQHGKFLCLTRCPRFVCPCPDGSAHERGGPRGLSGLTLPLTMTNLPFPPRTKAVVHPFRKWGLKERGVCDGGSMQPALVRAVGQEPARSDPGCSQGPLRLRDAPAVCRCTEPRPPHCPPGGTARRPPLRLFSGGDCVASAGRA